MWNDKDDGIILNIKSNISLEDLEIMNIQETQTSHKPYNYEWNRYPEADCYYREDYAIIGIRR